LDLHLLKSLLLSPLYLRGMSGILSSLTNTHGCIFMLHRFFCPERGVEGLNPEIIRKTLSKLRRENYDFVSLRKLVRRLTLGQPLGRSVAFTLDDGYFDQAEVAAPIFEEADCPVTIFLASGFVDRQFWFWWDQVQYIFENSPKRELEIDVAGVAYRYELKSHAARVQGARQLSAQYQRSVDGDVGSFISRLAIKAEVEVPVRAPAQFEPLSWEQARALEKRGVDFGIHTVSHHRLAGLPEEQSEWEIAACWKRLQQELSNPLPVLCYPFGRQTDYGRREMKLVSQMHLLGAVTASSGDLSDENQPVELFALPRYPAQNDMLRVLQCASGLERMKCWIRGTTRNI